MTDADHSATDADYYAQFDPDKVGTLATPKPAEPQPTLPAVAPIPAPAPEPMIGADSGLDAMRAGMVAAPIKPDAPASDPHSSEDAEYLSRFNPYPQEQGAPQEPTTALGTLRRAAGRAVLPIIGGAAIAGPFGAVGGLGAAAAGLVAGAIGGYATDRAQDYTIKSLPQAAQEAIGQDERTQIADQTQHATASMIGGVLPMFLVGRPGGFTRSALPPEATIYQRLAASPVAHSLTSGAIMGGVDLAQQVISGQPINKTQLATSTAVGMFFNHPTRFGETLNTWGGRFNPTGAAPAVDAQPDTSPTVAQVGDAKIMGPGVTEEVWQGAHQMAPEAEMSIRDTARQEATAMGATPPGPDLHDVARRLDPETFARYDDLQAQRDTFRKTIADAVNPPDDVMAEATAKRDAVQADLDKIPTSGAGSDKSELRRLRAQVRDAQRGVDALQARRDAFAAGTATDTPEAAAARQHLQNIDYEMRDLAPMVAAANRRAADHLASETVPPVPLPAEPPPAVAGNAMVQMLADRGEQGSAQGGDQQGLNRPQVPDATGEQGGAQIQPPAPAAPTELAPGAPIPGLDIAADIARQLIAAGRPEAEARAGGKLAEAYYKTKAAKFKGALGTAEDLYRKTAPQMVGPDGRRIPGPAGRPVDPAAAPRAPEPVSPTPAAAAAAPEATPRAPRAPRQNASLLEFLAQSGGIAPNGETRALFDRRSPFLPGIGPLVRKTGMTLDQALRSAEEAGYLHDPGAEAGAGPRTLGPNDLLDAIAREHGGTKIYRPGDEPPAPRLTRAEQRDEIERHLVDELHGVGLDANDIDKPTLDAVVDRLHKGEDSDPLHAYERVVMEREDQDERDREHRVDDAGEIPGWDVPADAVPASAARGVLSRAGEGATGRADRNGADRGASRPAGEGDRSAHERWLDSLTADDLTYFQAHGDQADGDRLLAEIARRISAHREPLDDGALNHGARGERSIVDEMNDLLGRTPQGDAQPRPSIEDEMNALIGRAPGGPASASRTHPDLIPAGDHLAYRIQKSDGRTRYELYRMPEGGIDGVEPHRLGEPLGHATLDRRDDGRWEVSFVRVAEENRRQGVARKLYEVIQGDKGIQMQPSGHLLPDGYAMWQARDPEAVKWHQQVEDDYLSPRKLLETAEDLGPEEGQEYRDAFDALPPEAKTPEALATMFQGSPRTARGSITFRPGQRPLLRLMSDANASTFVHESGHQFLEEMMQDANHPAAPDDLRADAQTVRDWLRNDGGPLKTSQHEKFATGFEQYLREGRAPSPELAGVFSQFRDWLVGLYRTLKGLGQEIPEDIRGVFDRLLSTEPNRTVIAPEREGGPGLGDIHKADADEIEPHHADGGADRIEAESARAVAEAHPEIIRELEAEDARIATAREAAAGGGAGAEPAGQAGGDAGQRQPLDGSGGKPEPVTGRVGPGTPADAERPGGGEATAEGAGLRDGERTGSAAAGSDDAGRAADDGFGGLAPKPSPRFGSEQSRLVDKAGNIRLENLTTSEDVRQAIRDAAAENQDFIGDRGGVVTDGEVVDLATAAGMPGALKLVADRVKGQAFNAVEVMTLRRALVQSATSLANLARRAATGSDDDVLAYAEAKSRHQMIQGTAAQATAEAGRALRAFRDISMSGEAKQADLFAREATGRTLFQLKREAALMGSLQTPDQVSKLSADLAKPGAGRMLLELYVNGLISGPTTHMTYAIGNTALTAWRMTAETPTAAALGTIRRAMGGEGGARFGEVAAQYRAAGQGLFPAVQAGIDALRTNATTLLPGETSAQIPFQFTPRQAAELDQHASLFSIMQGMRNGVTAAGGMARVAARDLASGQRDPRLLSFDYDPSGAIPNIAVRGVPVLPVGDAIRLPGRSVGAIHSFFRSMNYSIDIGSQAYRMATEEGRQGASFNARVADLMANPTDAMMESARAVSTNLTLMGQGGELMRRISSVTNWETNLPGVGSIQPIKFVDPFVKISGNIMNEALMQRTPLGLFSEAIRDDLAGKNGAAARDFTGGRLLAGSALAMTFAFLAKQGLVTGSGRLGKNDEETRNMQANDRAQGWMPHSMRIGDSYYDLHRLGPLGTLLSVAADMSQVGHYMTDGDLTKVGAALMRGFGQNIMDESWAKGPSDLIQALTNPAMHGDSYVRQQLPGFIPFSSALGQMARAGDPYAREARTVMDSVLYKLPGYRETLAPKIDIIGRPVQQPSAMVSPYVTALYTTKVDHDPALVALDQAGEYPSPVERHIRGVELTEPQYAEYAAVAGTQLRQRMAARASQPDWRMMPQFQKNIAAKAQVTASREIANGWMMAHHPDIVAASHAATLLKKTGQAVPQS